MQVINDALIVDANGEEASSFDRRYRFRPYLNTPNRSRLEGVGPPPQASRERCVASSLTTIHLLPWVAEL